MELNLRDRKDCKFDAVSLAPQEASVHGKAAASTTSSAACTSASA